MDQTVNEIAALGIEAGMWFVEKPKTGSTSNHDGNRGTTTLTSRQSGNMDGPQPAAHAKLLHRFFGSLVGSRRRAIGIWACTGPEPHILFDGQIVIERRGMAK